MPSALKRGCKHQRQRQEQKKTGEAYNFRTPPPPPPPPPPPLLSFLLPKPGIHSFKSVGNPLQNERDHAHPDLANLFFFFLFSSLFFSFFFFFYSLSRFLFFFLLFVLSKPTPFCAPSIPGTPLISLGLPQLHKHSSIPKVHS